MGLILFAKITKTHGLSGELKVHPFSKDLSSFSDLKKVYLQDPSEDKPVELQIEKKRFHKNFAIIKFKGIDTAEDSHQLVNKELLIDKTQLGKLDDDEFYWFQLIGMKVFTEKNEYIGKVSDLLDNGAQEILIVKTDNKEFLIPFVEKFIIETNLRESKIVINPVDGLLE